MNLMMNGAFFVESGSDVRNVTRQDVITNSSICLSQVKLRYEKEETYSFVWRSKNEIVKNGSVLEKKKEKKIKIK